MAARFFFNLITHTHYPMKPVILPVRLKLMFRHFVRNKSFTWINILGLSAGLACALYALMFIMDEVSYDRFHNNTGRIFRISAITTFNETQNRYATTSAPLAEAIRSDIPEVEACGRIFFREGTVQLISANGEAEPDKKFRERNVCFADPQLFDILSFNFLEGNPRLALSTPSQAVISRRLAVSYFGSVKEALNKRILFEGSIPLEISGVFEDYPEQSHMTGEFITHFDNYYNMEQEAVRDFLRNDWLYNPVSTYLLLRPSATAADATVKVNALNERYADERVRAGVRYELQPVEDIHLYSSFTFQSGASGIRQVFILAAVSFLILLIACFNFINLSTVHSLKRGGEIGLRKALGAGRRALILQFFGESALLVLLSLITANILLYTLLPYLNTITGKNLSYGSSLNPSIIAGAFGVFILTTAVAGFYPALSITKFSPVATLRGHGAGNAKDSIWLRRTLVMFQFCVSIVLIMVAVVIRKQLAYLANKPLGFEKELMVTIPLFSDTPNAILGSGVDGAFRGRMNTFEDRLLSQASFEAVTASSVLPGGGAIPALVVTEKYQDDDNIFIPVVSVDYDFIQTYSMEIVAGRPFSKEFGTDHLQAFILNEEAVKDLGWATPEDALDQPLQTLGKEGTVVGVIRNYHFDGLQQEMRPLILEVAAYKFTTFSVRLASDNLVESLATLENTWDEIFPERVFEYNFLDDQLAQNYQRDQRFSQLVNLFCLLAILLSCLGLFGLSAYINHMRLREVSIRKVLGASMGQVFFSLSREFVRTLALAIVAALPVGYLLAREWLGGFAYRTDISWQPFVVSTVLIVIFVLLTIAHNTVRTANCNPAEVLKRE